MMDLDNLKNAVRQVKAPLLDHSFGGTVDEEDLLEAIKAVDAREYRSLRKALPFYLIAGVAYALGCAIALAGFSSGEMSRTIHLGALATVMLLGGVLILAKLRSLRGFDYSSPVRSFLTQTEKRYRFMRPVDVSYSVPLLLLLAVTGGFFVVDAFIPRRLSESQVGPLVVGYGLFFATVCAMGYYFTYRNWKREKGEVLENIRRIRRELESE